MKERLLELLPDVVLNYLKISSKFRWIYALRKI